MSLAHVWSISGVLKRNQRQMKLLIATMKNVGDLHIVEVIQVSAQDLKLRLGKWCPLCVNNYQRDISHVVRV